MRRSKSIIIIATLLTFFAGCGEKGSGDEESASESSNPSGISAPGGSGTQTSVTEDQPADSTGQYVSVGLDFNAPAPTTLGLQTTAVTLTNGLVVSDARVSIKAVKLKADKVRSEAEKSLKEEMKLQKKEWEKGIEAQKQELEEQIEALKLEYEPQFEAASEAEEEALEAQFESDEAVIKQQMADLEKSKDEQEEAFEYERDNNVRWKGPYVFDMLAGSTSPAIPSAQVLDGSYKRIEFKIAPNRDVESTDKLLNQSIYVAGLWNNGSEDVTVEFFFPKDEEFRLMGAGAFVIDGDAATNALTVAFSMESWFAGIDFTAATPDAAGTIVIAPGSNDALWTAIRENIKRSAKFGKDEDGDGELEDEESEGDGDEGYDELEIEDEDDEEDDEEDDQEGQD